MKHKFPSVPDHTSDQNARRNAGQAIAAFVMALALTVGGAGTTILLATQPAGLTVAPAAVEWEAPAISLQPEKSASTEAASESTAEASASSAAAEETAPSQAPASSAAVPVTPTEAEVPASSTEPAAEAPVEEAPAAVPDETPAEPSAETPAADPMAGPAEENDHENALFPHFVQETAELAAEDPLSAPVETLEAEAAETPAASENGEAVASAGISDTNGTILLTPEEIRAALDAGTLDESSVSAQCLDSENGFLKWLWNLLFFVLLLFASLTSSVSILEIFVPNVMELSKGKINRKKSAVLGLIMILVILLLAIFGPGMNDYTYSGQDLSQKNFAPRVPGIEQFGILDGSEKMSTTTGTKIVNNYVEKGKDDVYYWFGSDLYGRDIWTRTWEGARVSLIIAVAAAVIDMVIGMSYGLVSGYFGGKVDMLMQRFLEIANGIPRLVIVTLLLLVLQPGMVTIIFALMLTEWVGMSRIARAEMLKLKDQEFVLASRTLGAGSFFIIFKEVLPNIIGPIITQVMFSIPTAIFTEAFLSFVGLGIPVPQCSLGSLISELYNSFTTHPYQIIPPIVVMSLLMLSFNLLADGLREALDPKMKSM